MQTGGRGFGQVDGHTYTNMLGLIERFICAKMLEVRRDHSRPTRWRSKP